MSLSCSMTFNDSQSSQIRLHSLCLVFMALHPQSCFINRLFTIWFLQIVLELTDSHRFTHHHSAFPALSCLLLFSPIVPASRKPSPSALRWVHPSSAAHIWVPLSMSLSTQPQVSSTLFCGVYCLRGCEWVVCRCILFVQLVLRKKKKEFECLWVEQMCSNLPDPSVLTSSFLH